MIKVKGRWFVSLYGPDGTEKQNIEGDNVITQNGLSGLVSHLVEATVAATTFTFQYIGIGAASGAASSTDSALGTELARTTGTVSQIAGGIYRVTATFPSGLPSTGSVSEYALFDSSAAGTMFSRDVESVVNKLADDTLTVQTEVTFS